MKTSWQKASAILIVGIFSCSIVMTLLVNGLWQKNPSLFHHFIDYLFFTTFAVFLVGSIMLIAERGLFDVFIYSTNKVRSITSDKYVYTLKESENLEDHEIQEFLREKYLYKKRRFSWTWPTFLSSSAILLGLLVYILWFYGI